MIAICRAILAAVFLVAVWIDPDEPARNVGAGFALLTTYLGWTLIAALIAWRSWWWDFRLARLAQIADIGVFITASFFTETNTSDFGSPFIAFAAFLLLTAAVRWRWRGVVATALLLLASYGLAGLAIKTLGLISNPYQFERRMTYMIVLSIMIVWLSIDQQFARLVSLPEPAGISGKRRPQVLAGALAFARDMFNARNAAIAVSRPEEPWIDLYRDIDGVFMHERVGPDGFPGLAVNAGAVLFDRHRRRRIVWHTSDRYEAVTGSLANPLLAALEAREGLLGGFAAASSHGHVVVWDAADTCTDNLPAIAALAQEIGHALDREEMAMLAQSIAVSHARNALARDLHDSAAQFLAGTQFRLEAMRRWIRQGGDPETEITAMKAALRSEQSHMRAMIDRLRHGIDGDRSTDLVAEIEGLLVELGDHWHIAATLRSDRSPLPVPIGTAYELRQVVREAVANAVRHGNCSRMAIDLDQSDHNSLLISIADNGKGLPEASRMLRPQSISERIEALGGTLRIASNAGGVQLDIDLPLVSAG